MQFHCVPAPLLRAAARKFVLLVDVAGLPNWDLGKASQSAWLLPPL